MKTDVIFSRKSDEWATPQEVFDSLNDEFHFDIDVCATAENAKCDRFFTAEDDGLAQEWEGRCWCNPPYSNVAAWMEKAQQAVHSGAEVVVALVFARTDTRWFHEYIYGQPNVEVRFIKGRLKFGNAKNNAPAPSMIVVFRNNGRMV